MCMQREQPLTERVIDQSGGMGLTVKYVDSEVAIMEGDGNLSMIGIEHE